MSRSTSSDRRITRRRKILKLAKGFRGRRGTNFKAARDAVRKALLHSYV
ncbi:50S ribosomal protein L20, partial [Treponema pedis]